MQIVIAYVVVIACIVVPSANAAPEIARKVRRALASSRAR